MSRRAGLLFHPLSLPGPFPGGTLGRQVERFLDLCSEHHQTVWQVLPLGPTGYGDSPYQSFSTHAGNPYLIDLEILQEWGLATEEEVAQGKCRVGGDKIDYSALYEQYRPILLQLALEFPSRADREQLADYGEFCEAEAWWLDDFAIFMTAKGVYEKAWSDWPKSLRLRSKKELASFSSEHSAAIAAQKVLQWLFFEQWSRVREEASRRGISVLGDLPIFVALDSADAWAHPELFLFDKERRPEAVAGVPPDYFSADGQLWGNPLYHWSRHQKRGFRWWKQRVGSTLRLFDTVRIDHFRGFAAFWKVPAGETTARNGAWVEAPGEKLFTSLQKEFPELPIVAEDLGDITPDVTALRDRFGFPGMKVLQFAFSDPANEFLPHHYGTNFVVYPGTHDNDTVKGWYTDPAYAAEQKFFRHYLGLPSTLSAKEAVEQMVRLGLRSTAELAVTALQDVWQLGSEARMNTPSQGEGNWQWRASEKQISEEVGWFKEAAWIGGRA